MAKARKAVTWGAIAVSCVAGFEGLRTVAYRDPVGIPTVCFGETKGVKMGDRYTPEQCKDMLEERLIEFAAGVEKCTRVELPPHRKAAAVSFAYNVGTGAYCSSTFVRRLNAGEGAAACGELMKWTRAKGIELPGLVRRRKEEMALCQRED